MLKTENPKNLYARGMDETRVIESACPSCGAVARRETYDIGSGPELACANCEWCWGAEGQDLKPIPDLCPDCPMCGHPPKVRLGVTQAFCGNDDCRCMVWNPAITQALNLADINEVDLPDLS